MKKKYYRRNSICCELKFSSEVTEEEEAYYINWLQGNWLLKWTNTLKYTIVTLCRVYQFFSKDQVQQNG